MRPPAHAAVILCALAGAAAAQPATDPVPAPSSNPSIAESADAMPKAPVAMNGAFITSVPIDLPPGRGGLVPGLSLDYSSLRGNGLAGVGWTLTGLPAITRFVHGRELRFDGGDGYAYLPGGFDDRPHPDQRLVKKGARYHLAVNAAGAPSMELEPAGTCGDGPCYWMARDGNGRTYYFGGDADTPATSSPVLWEPDNGVTSGRGIQTWALHKVTDPYGNYYQVTYYRNTWSLRPREIRYTLTTISNSLAFHRVMFEYEQRPELTPMPYRHDQRLSQIIVHGRCLGTPAVCSPIRTYLLTYETSIASGRSRLKKVEERGDDGVTTRRLLEMTWTAGGLENNTHPIGALQVWPHTFDSVDPLGRTGWINQTCDLDGDGKDDLVRVFEGDIAILPPSNVPPDTTPVPVPQYALAIQYAMSHGTGFEAPVTHHYESPTGRNGGALCGDVNLRDRGGVAANTHNSATLLLPDINGDGRHDVVLVPRYDRFDDPPQMVYAVSVPGLPDQVETTLDRQGGSMTIEYAHLTANRPETYRAIEPGGGCRTSAGHVVDPACGISDRRRRDVVVAYHRFDGRSQIRATHLRYRNGRRRPGPPDERAELGFEQIAESFVQTGSQTTTDLRQDPPFHGYVAARTFEIESCKLTQPCGLEPMSITTFAYVAHAPAPGISIRGPSFQRVERLELGTPVSWVETTTLYDSTYGVVTEDLVCSSNAEPCAKTLHAYSHDPDGTLGAGRWVIGRPWATWTIRLTKPTATLIAADQYTYHPARPLLLRRHDRLLFPEAELALCANVGDPAHPQEACATEVSQGKARWVPVEQDLDYDLLGNPGYREDALGHATTFTHETDFLAYVWRDVDAAGLMRVTLHDHAGRIYAADDANRQRTTFHFDPFGRVAREVPPGIVTAERTKWQYISDGVVPLQQEWETRYASATASHRVRRLIDGDGRVYSTVDETDRGNIIVQHELSYSADGELIDRQSIPRFPGDPVKWIETRHDGAGRPTVVNRVDATFNVEKQLATYTYHSDGSTTVRDTSNRTERRYVDAFGRLVRVDDASAVATTWRHDPAGRVTRVTLPVGKTNNVVLDVHDTLGRRVRHADATTGTSRYAFDDVGNLIREEDAAGRVVTYGYDDINRMKLQTGANNNVIASFVYDQPGYGQSLGHLTTVTDRSGAAAFHYDARGNVNRRDHDVGLGVPFTYVFSHDQLDRVRTKEFPDGRPDEVVQELRYSNDGLLTDVINAGITFAHYSDHDAQGGVRQEKLYLDPTLGSYSVTVDHTYDADHRLYTRRAVSRTNAEILSQRYGYDPIGNLLSLEDLRAPAAKMVGTVNTDEAVTYGYDALSRLRSASGVYGARQYAFDAQGNITRNGGAGIDYRLCNGGHCIDGSIWGTPAAVQWTATHDAAGLRTKLYEPAGNRTVDYVYDERGQLGAVYDRNALLVQEVRDHGRARAVKRFHHPGGFVVTTYYIGDAYELRTSTLSPGQWATTHRVGDLATINGGGSIFGQPTEQMVLNAASNGFSGSTITGPGRGTWLHLNDPVGSSGVTVRATTAAVVSRLIQEPWGTVATGNSTGRDAHTHKFAGSETDEETGLLAMGERSYDPRSARFLTPDPVVPSGTDRAPGYNRFAYSLDNPVRYRDPTGREPEKAEETKPEAADAEKKEPNHIFVDYWTLVAAETAASVTPNLKYGSLHLHRWLYGDGSEREMESEEITAILRSTNLREAIERRAGEMINGQPVGPFDTKETEYTPENLRNSYDFSYAYGDIYFRLSLHGQITMGPDGQRSYEGYVGVELSDWWGWSPEKEHVSIEILGNTMWPEDFRAAGRRARPPVRGPWRNRPDGTGPRGVPGRIAARLVDAMRRPRRTSLRLITYALAAALAAAVACNETGDRAAEARARIAEIAKRAEARGAVTPDDLAEAEQVIGEAGFDGEAERELRLRELGELGRLSDRLSRARP